MILNIPDHWLVNLRIICWLIIFLQLSVWIISMIRIIQSEWDYCPFTLVPISGGPWASRSCKKENHHYLELWLFWPIPQGLYMASSSTKFILLIWPFWIWMHRYTSKMELLSLDSTVRKTRRKPQSSLLPFFIPFSLSHLHITIPTKAKKHYALRHSKNTSFALLYFWQHPPTHTQKERERERERERESCWTTTVRIQIRSHGKSSLLWQSQC